MRIERVVLERAWFPFGRQHPGCEERSEKRLILSEREKATLRSAAVIVEKARRAVDPHEWDDIRHSEALRGLAMSEAYLTDLLTYDFYVVDDWAKQSAEDALGGAS